MQKFFKAFSSPKILLQLQSLIRKKKDLSITVCTARRLLLEVRKHTPVYVYFSSQSHFHDSVMCCPCHLVCIPPFVFKLTPFLFTELLCWNSPNCSLLLLCWSKRHSIDCSSSHQNGQGANTLFCSPNNASQQWAHDPWGSLAASWLNDHLTFGHSITISPSFPGILLEVILYTLGGSLVGDGVDILQVHPYPIEWFHYSCISITRKPRGKWCCLDKCKLSHVNTVKCTHKRSEVISLMHTTWVQLKDT